MLRPQTRRTLNLLSATATLVVACNAAAQPSYLPVGPQTNIPVATVSAGGWSQCYLDNYTEQLDAATVLSACTEEHLMLACRVTGSSTLNLLAQAPRSDVLAPTGTDATTVHTANGTDWYFDNSGSKGNGGGSSWGFARQGDTVNRDNCDTAGFTEPSGVFKLCWHFEPPVVGGYRCGDDTSEDGIERVVYQARAAVPPPPPPADAIAVPTISIYGMMLSFLGLLVLALHRLSSKSDKE
jgi:hypothetical protein